MGRGAWRIETRLMSRLDGVVAGRSAVMLLLVRAGARRTEMVRGWM